MITIEPKNVKVFVESFDYMGGVFTCECEHPMHEDNIQIFVPANDFLKHLGADGIGNIEFERSYYYGENRTTKAHNVGLMEWLQLTDRDEIKEQLTDCINTQQKRFINVSFDLPTAALPDLHAALASIGKP